MSTLIIKVGQMPGKLVEVAYEEGISAREIFELANVEVSSNHEVRLNGRKINIDDSVYNGGLLVAMKMIKGNATIKVGQMPGRLENIEYQDGETARNLFSKAGVELANHEIRLDGNKIDIDSNITGGNLLVAMKMIKGNKEIYTTELCEQEVETILGASLPRVINTEDVVDLHDNNMIIVCDCVIEADLFDSIYKLTEVQQAVANNTFLDTICDVEEIQMVVLEDTHECKCNNGREYVEKKIYDLQQGADLHWSLFKEYDVQIKVLKDVLENM